jgi:hypothetical protein
MHCEVVQVAGKTCLRIEKTKNVIYATKNAFN